MNFKRQFFAEVFQSLIQKYENINASRKNRARFNRRQKFCDRHDIRTFLSGGRIRTNARQLRSRHGIFRDHASDAACSAVFSALAGQADFRKLGFRKNPDRGVRGFGRRNVQTISERSARNVQVSADDTVDRDGDAFVLHPILRSFKTSFGKIGKRRNEQKNPRLFREKQARIFIDFML